MKFSDIDFSALHQMMDSMNEEEKASLNDMANTMMNNMKENPEDELDMYDFLHIQEEDYADMPVLDLIESAVELEDFYDGDPEADYSASVLFYAKAVLGLLRTIHFPVYAHVLDLPDFQNAVNTTIYSYLAPLMNPDHIHTLVNENFGTTEAWNIHKNALQQIYVLLNRAEYDFIRYEELQTLKALLFDQKALLSINELL